MGDGRVPYYVEPKGEEIFLRVTRAQMQCGDTSLVRGKKEV